MASPEHDGGTRQLSPPEESRSSFSGSSVEDSDVLPVMEIEPSEPLVTFVVVVVTSPVILLVVVLVVSVIVEPVEGSITVVLEVVFSISSVESGLVLNSVVESGVGGVRRSVVF
jgi:hypothetical protein